MAGMAFASGGLGAVHALAYPIGTEYHLSHGRSNAVMLPHVMRFNLSKNPDKYAAIAALMGKKADRLSAPEAALISVEDDVNFITGQLLLVDGGFSLK